MNIEFEILLNTRNNFIRLISGLSAEQLNKIPNGLKNNIIWNFGHIISAQHGLCYRLSGLPLPMDIHLINKYKKDTLPPSFVEEDEINFLKQEMLESIERLKADYSNNIFKNYTPYTTAFGMHLASIEDAIKYVAVHDGIHFGYSMVIKKFV